MHINVVTYWPEQFGGLCSAWKRSLSAAGHSVTIQTLPFSCPDPVTPPPDTEVNLLLAGRSLLRNLVSHGLPRVGRNVLWLFDPVTSDGQTSRGLAREVAESMKRVGPQLHAFIGMEVGMLEFARAHFEGVKARFLPVTIEPELIRAPLAEARRELDVLHIGNRFPQRVSAEAALATAGIPARFVYNSLWGAERDATLAATRVVLNIHRDGHDHFEQFRIFEAWAAGAAVVSMPCRDLGHYGITAGRHLEVGSLDEFPELCRRLLRDVHHRESLTAEAQALLRSRYTPHHWVGDMRYLLAP